MREDIAGVQQDGARKLMLDTYEQLLNVCRRDVARVESNIRTVCNLWS